MKPNLLLIVAFLMSIPCSKVFTQQNAPGKFGKITPRDFDLSGRQFDTSVNAVVISDVGSSSFEGNNNGWFTLMHNRQKRIKILNKNGFDAANISVYLYNEDKAEEKLNNLKATTYNLENGQVIETKLDNKDVFKEKYSDHLLRKKFTFPAVKAGSIIEFSYTLASDFLFNLQPWTFQGEYPCLWSEYNVSLPEFFDYVYMAQGYQPFYIKTSKQSYQTYNVQVPGETLSSSSRNVSLAGTVTDSRWVIKDVPPIKEENFTSCIDNHLAKIEFQLSQYRFPNSPVKSILGNWATATEHLLQHEEFGVPIDKVNNWLDDDLRGITTKNADPLDKAKDIYAYVRNNFTCIKSSGLLLSNPLKTIFKNKNGSVADINLLLVSMLRHEKIEADPVILSTREHGLANELYPLINRFNYVIAAVKINNEPIYLDASQPLGFGKLSEQCYNGMARVISKQPNAVYLIPIL